MDILTYYTIMAVAVLAFCAYIARMDAARDKRYAEGLAAGREQAAAEYNKELNAMLDRLDIRLDRLDIRQDV